MEGGAGARVCREGNRCLQRRFLDRARPRAAGPGSLKQSPSRRLRARLSLTGVQAAILHCCLLEPVSSSVVLPAKEQLSGGWREIVLQDA